MRNKKTPIAGLAALVVLVAGIVVSWQTSHPDMRTVLKRLDVSQVESIAVYRSHFSPALEPETGISESDAERVVSLLRQVRLSGEPTQDYANWQGLNIHPFFHVKLKNGTEFDFSACPPFFLTNTENLGYIPHQRRENTIMGYQSPQDHFDEDYQLSWQIIYLYYEMENKYFR